MLEAAYRYALDNQAFFWEAVGTHVRLSGTALVIACGLCLPLGLYAARRRPLSAQILHLVNGLRVVPSLATLFLALPYLGLGFLPALVALTILACPPILANTEAGFRSVDRAVVEAARSMGMDGRQVLWRVEVPLALPVIVGGVRTAAVEVTASATLAAFIGGGGLGDFIYRGFALFDVSVMLVGAVPVAALTMLTEGTLAATQRWLQWATGSA
ncbi:MAG: ABC transporter permease [Armatimonadota bacterium]|nr:ABC transporter permease [Armatimonadota bacterium]MDR5697499.1 ABC transporter permease [Armatimonadota bacterium]